MRFPVVVGFGLVAVLASACSSSGSNPNDPSQQQGYGQQYGQGQYGQQGQYPPGQYGQQGQYPQQQGQYPQQQPQQQPQQTSGGGSATPISPMAASAATPVLQAMAANDARGMNPEGGAFAGQFQQGQILEQTFQATPGKCYTVVGVGLGITQLDISIQTMPPVAGLPAVTVAQSNTSGANATVGGGGNCVKYPLPVGGPFKVVLKATGGSGIAVAQLFSK